ncbi:MAG: histidinol-phosphatase, partial [Bacteroidota bacterium]
SLNLDNGHSFTHEINKSKKNVYKALDTGRCFISNFYHGNARGFRFYAESENKTYQMGDTVPPSKKVKLIVNLPSSSDKIRLIHNGNLEEEKSGTNVEFLAPKKGVYRVEVYNNQNAWIFSNHIRIGL